jgi:hypothetical protein
MGFALLQAKEVGVHFVYDLLEAFFEAGPDSVHVPRHDAHGAFYSIATQLDAAS